MRVTVDDLVFDVDVAGPEDGEAVLLLHGFPHSRESWTDIAPLLHRAGLRTVAPDQRGYSPGARPEAVEAYALPELAADALGVLDALGIEAAHVAGHDWGAVVGWYLAARFPGRVRSLTAAGFPHLDAFRHALRVDHRQRLHSGYIDTLSAEDAADTFLADGAAGLEGWYRQTEGVLSEEQIERYMRTHTSPGTLRAALKWYRAGSLQDDSDPLGPVTVPTTHIWSENDPAVGVLAAERTADHVTGEYRFVRLRGVSHWQPQQVPEKVAAEILDRVRGA
ncbi:epoxide hydrolase [Streptomyces ruber]|uniref:Epoxide hydrolase n=2 Tax=Streptomyces TaxID=1883 RepID=A0A918EQW2_9ACTN|nr:alpha/beta hydrolase [Streptomyces ruber]GGQ52973.1 epoxide hydrolase [Streptomyces ruber]